MVEIIIPLASFAMAFGMVYMIITSRTRERMAMIEKGVDLKSFESKSRGYGAIKFGMLAIGVALGLLIANIVAEVTRLDDDVLYFAFALLFGGAGLIGGHFMARKLREKDDLKEENKS
ncbi:MAG: hypothetical protein KDD36_10610 [Flavobacteriales bacterium]|nr:hypothetical protein [Flavobacteriales bacterium]